MNQVIYRVVKHEGGWAYKSGGVFSEAFSSHDDAVKAAKRVAKEQTMAGDTVGIEYQDEKLVWQTEFADSYDRPTTKVIE